MGKFHAILNKTKKITEHKIVYRLSAQLCEERNVHLGAGEKPSLL